VSHGKVNRYPRHPNRGVWLLQGPGKDRPDVILLDGESYVLTVTGRPLTRTARSTYWAGFDEHQLRGEKIFAGGGRRAVKRHPLIDDCLVVGIPDERFGQRVVAIVATVAPSPPKPKRSTSSFDCRWRTTRSQRGGRARNGPARAERQGDYKWAHEVALEEHVGVDV